jgi:hypothetical protein
MLKKKAKTVQKSLKSVKIFLIALLCYKIVEMTKKVRIPSHTTSDCSLRESVPDPY